MIKFVILIALVIGVVGFILQSKNQFETHFIPSKFSKKNKSSEEAVLEIAKTLVDDPRMVTLPLEKDYQVYLQNNQLGSYQNELQPYFTSVPQGQLIVKLLVLKHVVRNSEGGVIQADEVLMNKYINELSSTPLETMGAIRTAYENMSGQLYSEEHAKLLEIGMLIARDPDARPVMRQMCLDAIQNQRDPVDPADPLSSVAIATVRNYLGLEENPQQMKIVMDEFIKRNPHPLIESELKRLYQSRLPASAE